MKKKLLPIFLLILAVCIFVACEDKIPLQQQTGSKTVNSSPQSETQPEAKPVQSKYVWPPATEKGTEVVLSAKPLAKNYYLVLDDSTSMEGNQCAGSMRKIDVAKQALINFSKLVPKSENLGLMSFNDGKFTEWVPLGMNDEGHQKRFLEKLKQIVPIDSTPMHNAVVSGLRSLEKQAQKQLGYGEYHLIIVTDGLANAGQDPTNAVQFILDNTPIVIHTIGFCIDTDNPLNQPGKTIYSTATNPDELNKGLKDVLAESEKFSDISDFKK